MNGRLTSVVIAGLVAFGSLGAIALAPTAFAEVITDPTEPPSLPPVEVPTPTNPPVDEPVVVPPTVDPAPAPPAATPTTPTRPTVRPSRTATPTPVATPAAVVPELTPTMAPTPTPTRTPMPTPASEQVVKFTPTSSTSPDLLPIAALIVSLTGAGGVLIFAGIRNRATLIDRFKHTIRIARSRVR